MFLLIEDRIAARSAERSALGHNVHSDGQFQAGLERSTLFDGGREGRQSEQAFCMGALGSRTSLM